MEDTDPTSASRNGWLEDTSKVEKYVMSEEDYNKRDGTYRSVGRGLWWAVVGACRDLAGCPIAWSAFPY